MARCFCGCGRRVLIKGRVANVYGDNANTFAEMVRELLDDPEDAAKLVDRTPDELGLLLDSLEAFRTGYRAVMHGDMRLREMDYDAWVLCRDEAFGITLLIDERVKADPRRRRLRALGQWAIDEDLTEDQALQQTLQMDPADFERIISRYDP
jgi:hypothetical protein